MDKMTVNSYDEWTQLQEVIVGHVDGFSGFHLDSSFNLFYWDNVRAFLATQGFFRINGELPSWPKIPIEATFVEELREDIQAFVDVLEDLGVHVRRPAPMVGNDSIQTPFWKSFQSPPLNVRDQAIVLGSSIVETAPQVRARLFENDYLKPLFLEYMLAGARWLSMPKPTLACGVLDSSFFSLDEEERTVLLDHHAMALPGLVTEMLFDGAQCLRLGRDVLVNVGNRNHDLGFRWLEAMYGGTFTFHRLDRMADSHIDSTILPLRPGVWLVRDKRYIDMLPERFRGWDFVVAPESESDLFPSYEGKNLSIASKFIDMNVLSVSEKIVIVNSLFPELISALERSRFEVVPVRHRHRRLFGGGFHCFTLDIRRSGGLESYGD